MLYSSGYYTDRNTPVNRKSKKDLNEMFTQHIYSALQFLKHNIM